MPALRTALIMASGIVCATVAAAPVQTPPVCRTFTAEEVRTLSGAGSGTITQSCRFDLATTSRICNMRSRINAGSFDLTYTDKYNSVADFVDEVAVVPPIARIQKQSRRYTSGSAPNAEITYEYDATRRQTRLSTNMAGNLLVTTYGGWDAAGRPTTATVSTRASTITLQYKYDDAKRTMTITGPAGVEVDTFDVDGNMIHEETTDGGGRTVFTFKINKTDKVCK